MSGGGELARIEVEPRVIHIGSRRRGFSRRWVLPLCVFALVSIGLTVRLSLDDWRGITPWIHVPTPRRIVKSAPRPVAIARLDSEPPLMIRPEAKALRPAPIADGLRDMRPRTLELVPPPDHPDFTADLAQREIAEEADRLRAERAKIALLRVQQPKLERETRVTKRLQRINNAIVEAEAERLAFHAEISAILKEHGDRAAPELMALMTRQIHRPIREISDAVTIALQKRKAPSSPARRIPLYRSLGMPEPFILRELLREECRKIPARNGPRDEEDAMLRAVKKLRSVPLKSREILAPSPVQVGVRMPQ